VGIASRSTLSAQVSFRLYREGVLMSPRRVLRKVRRLLRRGAGDGVVSRTPAYHWSTWTWTALAAARGGSPTPSYREISPGQTLYRDPPNTLEGGIHWRFVNRLQWMSPPLFLAVIPNGRVWGAEGAIVTPEGELIADLSLWAGLDPAEHNFFSGDLPAVSRHEGEFIALAAPRGDSYFHWMFDVVPRLEIVRRSGRKATKPARFLVNPLRHPFQEESLAILGISREQVTETSDRGYLEIERLIVPSFPGNSGEIPGWVCDFLRATFSGPASSAGAESGGRTRLYIRRGDARRRRVVNEAEVHDLLGGFGFRIVDPGQMTLVEQARLFATADIVVAPHGGALTNLVFCRPGTRVIEIFSPAYVNPCFWSLANGLGLPYLYVLGQDGAANRPPRSLSSLPRPGTERHPRGSGDGDIVVDIARLSRALRRVCDEWSA
jgi:hypothetical protein